MNKQELYDLGMSEYDKKNYKIAAENLRKAVEAGHPNAFGILYTLYTTPNEFPDTYLEPHKLDGELKCFAKKGDVVAALYLALQSGVEKEIDDAVKRIEDASNKIHDNTFQLVGPLYMQIIQAYSGLHAQTNDDVVRYKSKIKNCINQLKSYGNMIKNEQLLLAIPVIAEQFDIQL